MVVPIVVEGCNVDVGTIVVLVTWIVVDGPMTVLLVVVVPTSALVPLAPLVLEEASGSVEGAAPPCGRGLVVFSIVPGFRDVEDGSPMLGRAVVVFGASFPPKRGRSSSANPMARRAFTRMTTIAATRAALLNGCLPSRRPAAKTLTTVLPLRTSRK